MKIILTIFILSITLFAKTINIAVAANVSYAVDDLKKEFNKLYPNTKVNVILGSSGKLTAQISNGAPYQLFISADMNYPKALYKNGYAITKPIVYAKGSLALFSTKKLDLNKGLDLLKNDNINKIAIANPKTAPYGKATVEALKKAGIYNDIKKKLVFGESISQTFAYISIAADIGIVATSSLIKKELHWSEIDPALYTPIKQGIVILKDDLDVKKFYDFILSKNAKEIFKRYGYIIDD